MPKDMKRTRDFCTVFLTAFLLLGSGCAFAQQRVGWANWCYADSDLFWSNVYQSDSVGIDALTKQTVDYLTSRSYIMNIKSEPGRVTAEVTGLMIDHRKYKSEEGALTRAVRDGKWFGRIVYEVKENRYRVTFSGVSVDLGTKGAAIAGGGQNGAVAAGRSSANIKTASEMFVTTDETGWKERDDLFLFHQYLLKELEIKKHVVARGDF